MAEDRHYSLSKFLKKTSDSLTLQHIDDRQILSDHSTRRITAEQRRADQPTCEIHRSPTHQRVADIYTPGLGRTGHAS